MSKDALRKAVAAAGGQSELARRISTSVRPIKQGHVWSWLNESKGEVPPAEFVLPIEAAVMRRVSRHELRPDLYPDETNSPTADRRPV